VWMGYCANTSPAREARQTLLRPQRWEQSLSDVHHPLPADSLIPMFEGMVDRALSRTQPDTPLIREQRATNTPPWGKEASPGSFHLPAVRATSRT
jgi:hypothetical protein